jgi:phosphoserine aminotransferase
MLARHSGVHKVWSFASGPAAIPAEVLAEVQRDLVDWSGSGLSILELPFAGVEFAAIQDEVETDLRILLGLSSDFRVLFLQGGASAHFSLVPLNLLGESDVAAYVETGYWSARALAQAGRVCAVHLAARGRRTIPPLDTWRVPSRAGYCHVTTNETADGLQFHDVPDLGDVPLVADMTADLLTRPVDLQRYGLVYASAQKNLGAAGLTLVIVRNDLLGRTRTETPAPLDYTLQAKECSRVNTPPMFAIYLMGRMLKWLRRLGGVAAMGQRNLRKSSRLYDAIESSDFYVCPVPRAHRSNVNVCFRLPTASLTTEFLEAARSCGLVHLSGHHSVGGIRASLYNAVPEEAVELLAGFMDEFARACRKRV